MSTFGAAARALVVVNPMAAGGRAGRLEGPIRAWIRQQGEDADCATTASAPQLLELLRRRGPGTRVVVVGGDGTVHAALPALIDGQLELAVVPCGSGNDMARALGVAALDWPAALQLGLRGRASGVDIGEARFDGRSHWFCSSLTAGFDSAVGRRAAAGPSWLRGQPKYLWATLQEIRALRHWRIEVAADGRPLFRGDALFASVLNTPSYGSGLPAVPHARIDDHRLDLIVAGHFGRRSVLAMLPRLMRGRHLGDPRVLTQAFGQLTISSTSGALPVAADGESIGDAREIAVTVRPALLGMVRAPVAPRAA